MTTMESRLPFIDDDISDDISDEVLDPLLRQARATLTARLRHVRRPDVAVGITRSPLGPLLVAVGSGGIVMIRFLTTQDAAGGIAALRLKFDPVQDQPVAQQVGEEIRRFLAGERGALHHPADLSMVNGEFQRRLLKRLCEVPVGAVITYQALGATIGAANSPRAVGNAMAANPVPIYVPCHRVVRADGVIGNYGGGTQCKVKLLRSEGFAVDQSRRLPGQVVLGHRGTKIFCRHDCGAARRADLLPLERAEGVEEILDLRALGRAPLGLEHRPVSRSAALDQRGLGARVRAMAIEKDAQPDLPGIRDHFIHDADAVQAGEIGILAV